MQAHCFDDAAHTHIHTHTPTPTPTPTPTTTPTGKVFDSLPKSLSSGASGSSLPGVAELDLGGSGGADENAAAAHVQQEEAQFRTRTNTAGKVAANEDWSSYRTRTMSFNRASSNSAQTFDE